MKQKSEHLLIYLEAKIPFHKANENLKLQCDSLKDYLSFTAPQYLQYLEKQLSLLDILSIQVYQAKFKKALHKKALEQILYPFVLFLIYCVMVCFYKFYFVNELSTLLIEAKGSLVRLKGLQRFMTIHLFLIIIIVMSLVLFFFIYKSKDLFIMLVLKLNHAFKQNFITLFSTYQFIQYYYIFYQKGVDTKHTLNILRLASFPITCRWLAYHLEDSFQSGYGWETSYLDPNLSLFMIDTISRNKVIHNFEQYLEFTQEILMLKLRRLSVYFKGFVFILLAQVIFVYYQSLYLPLTILEGI